MSSEYEKGKKKGEEGEVEEEQRRRLQPQTQAQPQLRSIQRHLFPLLIFCCIFFCCSWQVMVMSCFSKAQSKCPKISHLETARIPLFRLGVQRFFPPGLSCQHQLQVRFWGFCLSKSSLPFSKHIKKLPPSSLLSGLPSSWSTMDETWLLYVWVKKRPQIFRSKTCFLTFHIFETHGPWPSIHRLHLGTLRHLTQRTQNVRRILTSEGFCNFKLGLLLVKLMSTATLLDGHSGHSPLVLFGLKLRKLMAGMFCQPLKQYVCGKRR